MRSLIYTFFLILLTYSFCSAQDLSGTWEGYGGGGYVKMVLARYGNAYVGYTYDRGMGYCKAHFLGDFNDSTKRLKGSGQGFIEKTFGHMLANYRLKYSSKPDGKYLTGLAAAKGIGNKLLAMGIPFHMELKQVSTNVDTTAYMLSWLRARNNKLVTVEPTRKTDSLTTRIDSASFVQSLPVFNKKAFDDSISTVKTQRTADTLRTIITPADSIIITISDNEIVDGDTITVFHNNEILVSRLFVSNHPYRIVVPLMPDVPVHEFVLVANNLGTIPPNTALLTIEAGKERYQLKAASDMKKNAVIIFKHRR
jgi:hypothetical protein